MTKKNVDYSTWKVGDKVKSRYYSKQKHIVRTITRIDRSKDHGGGFCVSADGGEPCPHCGHVVRSITGIAITWFEPYTGE